jgi:large subunit ribosomal protein L2
MSVLKFYKPTTPSRRHTSVVDYKKILTGDKPKKSLLIRKKRSAGRNNAGKITIRHRGGGARKQIRVIDFNRNFELGAKVKTIEYDPNRSAFICLVVDIKTGKEKYILHSKSLQKGDIIKTTDEVRKGNSIVIKNVPVGTNVSQIELNPGQGAKLVRAAGTYAVVTAKDDGTVSVKLPSSEIRKINENSMCVVDRLSNEFNELVRIGKAGRMRHKGFRPTVRGKVMNPVDHPHGGGEARNSIGMKYPKTPWGKHALQLFLIKVHKK